MHKKERDNIVEAATTTTVSSTVERDLQKISTTEIIPQYLMKTTISFKCP
jgi:hypothetical protein